VIHVVSGRRLLDTSRVRRIGLVLIVRLLAGCGGGAPMGVGEEPDAAALADAAPARPPAVIVMIGDGMGMAQLEVASRFAHGAPGQLAMEALPVRGEVRTGGPSGITDSAAAATVMATGVYTYNGNIGVDRGEQPVETVLERAAARGWATGVVTTTSLPHATPGAFTAHVDSRSEVEAIAAQQAQVTRPDVMLGGGAQYFAGLEADLDAAGYLRVSDAAGLAAAVGSADRVFGVFAPDQMTYVAERAPDSTEPELAEMATAALTVLDRDPDGFFLMIEGGRIDHAGHSNHLVHTIHETLAFDEAVAAVTGWARARGNTTVIVTADHECGGLALVTPAPAGVYPEVSWRWDTHTNARVAAFGEGPGTAVLDRAVVDHRWVYEIARARVDGDGFVEPARQPIPDGELADLRHLAAVQTAPSGFGPGFNQLDALWVDADAHGLTVGVEGVLQWEANAIELWLDVDPGSATGPPGLLAGSRVIAPAVPGFGVDLVVVARGGDDPRVEELVTSAGLRGVRAPFGSPADLGWQHAAINFGAVRTRGGPLTPVPGQGLEVFVPWHELYPDGVPAGARVALAAILVNDDGGYTSNQALPPFAAAAANPGRVPTPLPGIVVYELDSDGDGAVDGDSPPVVLP
jgi:alkaline phosphatase